MLYTITNVIENLKMSKLSHFLKMVYLTEILISKLLTSIDKTVEIVNFTTFKESNL